MKTRCLILALLLASPLLAQEPWSAEKAVEEFGALVTRKVARAEQTARNRQIADWLSRAEGKDLGEWSFLRFIARYFGRDYVGAADGLLSYLGEKGRFPNADYDMLVGRIFMNRAAMSAREAEFETASKFLPLALRYYPRRESVYSAMGTTLARSEAPEAEKFLFEVMRRILADDKVEDARKVAILTRILTPPAPRRAGPRPLKPFEATDLDGKPIALEDYRGKVVLVDFWATWCDPCLVEMPNVVAAYEKHHAAGLEIVGVSLDHEDAEGKIREVMKDLGMTWRQIYDGKGWDAAIAVANGVKSIPATFLLDRIGKVRYTNLRGGELAQRVAELLAESGEGGE